MILAASGHRPGKLGGYDLRTRRAVGALAIEHISRLEPAYVISGMALGWDQAVAGAAMILGIPVIAAVPFPSQHKRWPANSQSHYLEILDRCSKIVEISKEDPVSSHQATVWLDQRNKWMVEHCDRVIALWDGSWGGTFNCIKYARKLKRPIDNLWTRWTEPEELWGLL